MTENNSIISNSVTDFMFGMFSGLTARFIGWPIERIWLLRQEKPALSYKKLIHETFSKESISLLMNTYKRAGLLQSAAHAVAYMGVVNLIIRYNQAHYAEKKNWRIGLEAGVGSSFSETAVTFLQERKKAILFSGGNYNKIPIFSHQTLRCLFSTLIKNMIVNTSTVVLFLASYSHLYKLTKGTFLEPATSFFSGCVAAGPTQLIGIPFVNLQNRVLRQSSIKIGEHVSNMLCLKVSEIYAGILARWVHQMVLVGTSFTLLSIFNKQNIRASLTESDQEVRPKV